MNFTKRFTINDHIGVFFFKWIFHHMKTAMSTVPTGGLNLFSFLFLVTDISCQPWLQNNSLNYTE